MSETTQLPKAALSRRAFLTVSGGAVLATPFVRTSSAASRSLTIRDPGGPVGEAYKKAFFEPFAKAAGVDVIGVQSSHGPTGEIKAMVDAGNYAWDGALLDMSDVDVLSGTKYLETVVGKGGLGPNASQIPAELRSDLLIGAMGYATVLAYRTDTMGKKPPRSFADFWNVADVPGARSVRKHASGTLEPALLADGVAKKTLYPLDLDRAFQSLDRIKKDVAVWWTGGAQTSQMLKTGEVDCLITWNGRAQVAIDDGAPVKIVWKDAMFSFAGFAILKGGPNVELMREFIEFASAAENQAEFVKYSTSGPCNPKSFDLIEPKLADILPTNPKHFADMFVMDAAWWGANSAKAQERFETWLLG
ncbi:polyamine ABC transporter substrate-binding protein [Chelatococcus asaccharovorans]|uniref:polyamine ABC transporter substrate-binding protein n=1 Tax=Chelatococcus asaccharovorans TaxID=28210 RepID=UPI00224C6369|nr:polyamine ABC transporter substrate-binding protein [Chelatococcus asaccharovorans]CAH1652768.1 putative spermidine/putrescine transport system substrate-binding protein [Chelatococcus asaccharovorans]CAH1686239.1 putative spermidine/putrescine transport system substrate-binding protein [Chelatococcus asaccharovorans]